jgi:hypothetical protein
VKKGVRDEILTGVCDIDSCSCNGTEAGAEGENPNEIDFTTKA